MSASFDSLRARLRGAEHEQERRTLAVEEARSALERARLDRTAPVPVVEGSELIDRPPYHIRVAQAEAALTVARRRAAEAGADVDRIRATMGAVERCRQEVAKAERAMAAAVELDRTLSAMAQSALEQIASEVPRLRHLFLAAQQAREAVPLDARAGLEDLSARWLVQPGECVTDRLQRVVAP